MPAVEGGGHHCRARLNQATAKTAPPAEDCFRLQRLQLGCAGVAVAVMVFSSSVGLLGHTGVPGRPRPAQGLPDLDRVRHSAVVMMAADMATATARLSQSAAVRSWAAAEGHQYRFVPAAPRPGKMGPACPQQHPARLELALPDDMAGLTTVLCLRAPGCAPAPDLQRITATLSDLGIATGIIPAVWRSQSEPAEACHAQHDEVGGSDGGRPVPVVKSTGKTKTTTVVLQVADPAHLAGHEPHHMSVLAWALQTGQEYRFIPLALSPAECAYDAKVAAIFATLDDVHVAFGREVVFLDIDVMYIGNSSRDDLGALLPKSAPDGSRCWFTAQDNRNTINSGVLAVRKTPESVDLVRRWLRWQRVLHSCDGPADQLALQAAVLEFHGRELGGYDGHCETSGLSQADANGCYMKQMDNFGLPFNSRSTRGLCIVTAEIRFNLHDLLPGTWHPTDVLLHQHRIPCRLKNVPNCLRFFEKGG